jgi:2-oxoglutarate dehydrogenase E2 component (dihydrolipoamide succinyltransferase)
MATEVKADAGGYETITKAFVNRWLKPDGSLVRKGEKIVELGTDKASMELDAPVSGRLKHAAVEGAEVAIGTVIASIDEKVEVPSTVPQTTPQPVVPTPPINVSASPASRVLAADHNIDTTTLPGTGRDGRVIKEDVQRAIEVREKPVQPEPPVVGPIVGPIAPPVNPGGVTRTKMSPIRQRIAERLLQAQQTAAILTTFNEADMSRVMDLRTKYKEGFQKKYGVSLGFMSFFVKACIEALKAFPNVNSRLDGTEVVQHHYYNIGVAVSTEAGLMVPVLRHADQLSFAGIEKEIAALAVKARDKKIAVTDLEGGTFTITNGGIFGSMMSTPILNPPQVGILGMHAIQKRAVVVDDQIVIRPMMYLALSYDHRIIDGREAVSFLVRIKECIENPERMLLDI